MDVVNGIGLPIPQKGRRNRDRSGSALSLSSSASKKHMQGQRRHHHSTSNIRSVRGTGPEEDALVEMVGGRNSRLGLNDYSPDYDQRQNVGVPFSPVSAPWENGQAEHLHPVTERENGNNSDRSISPTLTTTTATGVTGNGDFKWAQLTTDDGDNERGHLSWAHRYLGSCFSAFLLILSLLSPLVMVVGPKVGFPSWAPPPVGLRECGTECSALLLSLALKIIVLGGAVWCIFCRPPAATMPRIFFHKSVTLMLAVIATFTFWLFYIVRGEEELSTLGAVAFAGGLVDGLLAVHYLGVLLTEVQHLSPSFQVSVLRSPDGVERKFCIGKLSIQRAAVFVLQRYYAKFPAYNPHMDRLPPLRRRHNSVSHQPSLAPSFKFYDLDGVAAGASMLRPQRVNSHNERFYEEQEFERRLRKRRARLIGATEEAFRHIKRRREEQGGGTPLDSIEAAAAVFPALARPLQKYLRLTRQLRWHTAESVLKHLATSLRLGLAPRAFLEKFTTTPTPLHAMRGGSVSSWALISDLSVSSTLSGNTSFVLRGGDETLFVSITSLPHFNITEQVIDPKNNKFTLRLGSETSV